MDIFLKIIKFLLTSLVNIIVLSGIIIVVAWAFWDVTPQESITKTAYFFSESWRVITGKTDLSQQPKPVTSEQLKDSRQNIRYLHSK